MNKDNPAPENQEDKTIEEIKDYMTDLDKYFSGKDNPAPVSAEEINLSDLYRVVLEKVYAEETNTWQMMNKVNIESGMGGIKKNSLVQLIENVLENNPTQPISDEEITDMAEKEFPSVNGYLFKEMLLPAEDFKDKPDLMYKENIDRRKQIIEAYAKILESKYFRQIDKSKRWEVYAVVGSK